MFEHFKRKLFFAKMELLFNKGINDGSIIPFDDEFYEAMSHTYISSIPVSMDIKYFKPRPGEFGNCYERSLKMFLCFNDALLVRGDNKDLEYMYSKEESGHGWIEIGDYVYDPTSLYRFKRDIYYQLYCPSNIKKYTLDEYLASSSNREFYENIKSTTIDDYKPGGSRRYDLCVLIPLLIANSKFYGKEYEKVLNDYLNSIEYDYGQIASELEREARELFMSMGKNLTK